MGRWRTRVSPRRKKGPLCYPPDPTARSHLATFRPVERPAAKPSSSAPVAAIVGRSPAFELWIAFLFSIVPHAAGLIVGGYGQIITNAPLAVVITGVDVVALVIAYLQFREDSQAHGGSHWLVWATVAVGGVWLVYAVFVGALLVFGHAFCINQDCRAPIR